MTSMPASRRARAITLAPRSWPSRPGLATRTRIFGSAIAGLFKHIGRSSDRFYIYALPQIPARDAAIWLPPFGDLLHLIWGGQHDFQLLWFKLLRFLAVANTSGTIARGPFLEIMLVHGHAYPKVTDRKNVGAAQRKHQEHVSSPDADALHLREMFDDLVVRHFRQSREIQIASISAFGHVKEIRRFLL